MSGKLCFGNRAGNSYLIKESKAGCEGGQARQQGVPFANNPHEEGSAAYATWSFGWANANADAGSTSNGHKCCAPLGVIPGVVEPLPPSFGLLPPSINDEIPVGGTIDFILQEAIAFGTFPITFTATGTLPTGITLDPVGTFTGTATGPVDESGSTTFVATNSEGSDETSVYSWVVV